VRYLFLHVFDEEMEMGMFQRQVLRVACLGLLAVLLSLAIPGGRRIASAVPIFAQSYGVTCNTCHTQMPILNAFGRYVKATAYTALDIETLHHALPIFIEDSATGYTYQPSTSTHQLVSPWNSISAWAFGFAGRDFTYHVEQDIVTDNQPGQTGQVWVAYNGIALGPHESEHRGPGYLHLEVGKVGAIQMIDNGSDAPLRDVTPSSTPPDFFIGQHDYAGNIDDRWGAKLNYVNGKIPLMVELAYLGNNGPPGIAGSFNYSPAAERSFQWKVAWAHPSHPWELGLIGDTGTVGWTGSLLPGWNQDRYTMFGPYVLKDYRANSPGFVAQYLTASDANPGYYAAPGGTTLGAPAGKTGGSAMIASVYQMILANKGMVNLSYFHTNNSLACAESPCSTGLVVPTGPVTAGDVGLSYAFGPFIRLYATSTIAQNQTPLWNLTLWIDSPLRNRR
jgi:hypothetical protein